MTTTAPVTGETATAGPAATETPTQSDSPPRRRSSGLELGRQWLEAGGVGALAVAIAALLMRVWQADWGNTTLAPDYGDSQFITMMVRGIHDHGWYLSNPDLGAPFGQNFHDYPHAGETLQLAVIRFLTLFTSRPFLVVNVYYLMGFGILAAITYLVFRQLRVGPLVSATVAVLYTFLPYHFWHHESHLYRSAYFSAPIGALLILWVLTWRTSFLHDAVGPLRGWAQLRVNIRWRRVLVAVALAAIVALTETMTIAFVLVTLMVAAAVVAVRDRDWGVLVAGAAVSLTVGVIFVAAMAPNLLYWEQHGTNKVAGRRAVTDQEQFGLKISQLVLPNPNSRIKAFDHLQQRTQKTSPLGADEGGQTLGFIGAIGLIGLFWGALRYALRAGPQSKVDDRKTLWGHSGLATLILLLFGAASGFGLVLSLFGFSQVRNWNRVVVLIAFFAMVVVAIGLERIIDWLRPRFSSRRVAGATTVALLLIVGAFGLWDTATPTGVPQSKASVQRARTLAAFDAALQLRLPRGASIFQLPVMQFPENGPINKMADYDAALPYLYSNGLRWSYGGMKGRPTADWQNKVNSWNPIPALPGIRGLGFDGVVVDTHGFTDNGRQVSALLTRELGPPEIVSSRGGRWRFWDLRDLEDRTHLSDRQLRYIATALVGPTLMRSIPLVRGTDT